MATDYAAKSQLIRTERAAAEQAVIEEIEDLVEQIAALTLRTSAHGRARAQDYLREQLDLAAKEHP
ncbi:MAG: hypothetical protein ACEQSX_00450 [Baekduiaceae bacterium]